MDETLTIEFSESDAEKLRAYKGASGSPGLERYTLVMPEIKTGSKRVTAEVEKALKTSKPLPSTLAAKLPVEILEGAKAAFVATGGNISEVASMYDLSPQAVLRLAKEEDWTVYRGSTKAVEAAGRAQLIILRDKLWARIEKVLNALDIESKDKADIVQHRLNSVYVEPLASRNSLFKNLMDQYMRVQALLEPEIFANDGDGTNFNARRAREHDYPGGIEGVNREMADFFSEVVVGIADKLKDRELNGYSHVIDTRASSG
jgi:hypothetical protein